MHYLLSDYDYELPSDLIAHAPAEPRDSCRLMIVDRKSGNLSEIVFSELKNFLQTGDSFVFNNTKVIPARLIGAKETGAKIEILLQEEEKRGVWTALAKPAKKARIGDKITFSDEFFCHVVGSDEWGKREVEFNDPDRFYQLLDKYGQMPLPPYIKRDGQKQEDKADYQTIFAQKPGACAAPTAGLHFTDQLLQDLKEKGIDQHYITLHVGLGTFRPVSVDDIRQHQMHSERYEILPDVAANLNATKNENKQICVGTTCLRTLESASCKNGVINPGSGATNIFIYPGYNFKRVNALLTNFHLPKSSLMMLVSAFGGYELMRQAYKKAVMEKYRFFSYGDAMLII